MLHRSFKPAKCKTALKLAVSRIKLLRNKRDAQVKQLKRELAKLLESGQDQTARIRVEHVVREEKTMAAYELVEIYCELIAARLPIIESQKNCPIDLKEAVSSVIFATPRCSDIPELADVKKHITAKYGKEFVTAAVELRPDSGVNRLLIEKLSAKAPDGPTKIKILTAIAEEHNIKWEPKSFGETDAKSSQDLLVGPSTFEKSAYAEPYQVHVPPSVHDEKDPLSSHATLQHKPVHDASTNSYEQNARAAARNASGNHSTTSGNGSQEIDFRDSYSENKSAFPVGGQNWNTEFKDAASAARAAAESAERANMAARAAAEFSNRENITRQYSSGLHSSPGSKSRDKVPKENVFHDDKHLSTGNVNSTFRRSSFGMRNEQSTAGEQDHLDGASNEYYRDSQNVVKHAQPASSTSGGSGTVGYDKPFTDGSELADIYDHSNLFGQENIDLHGMSIKKQARRTEEDFVTEFHGDGDSNTENNYHSGHVRTESESRKASSPHLVSPSDDHSHNLNLNNWTMGNTMESSSYNDTSVVFDNSESEDDDYKFDADKNYKGEGSGLFFSSPGIKSQVDPLENTNSLSHGQNTSEKESSYGTQSHFSGVSEKLTKSEVSFEREDPLPVTFDDSDDSDSDILDQIANHGALGSSSRNVENLGTDRKSSSSQYSVGSDNVEKHSERTVGVTTISEKNYGYDDLLNREPSSTGRSSISGSGAEVDIHTLPSRNNFDDTETLENSRIESGTELNYGTLKGGFRNKGYTRPPYIKNTSNDISSSLGDNSVQNERYLPPVRTSTSFDAPVQDKHTLEVSRGNRNVGLRAHNKSSDSNSYVLVADSPRTSSLREPRIQNERSETKKKPSSQASVPYFDSDDSEDELHKQKSASVAHPISRVSRRTSASPKTVTGLSSKDAPTEASASPVTKLGWKSSRVSYESQNQTASPIKKSSESWAGSKPESAENEASKQSSEPNRFLDEDSISSSAKVQPSSSLPKTVVKDSERQKASESLNSDGGTPSKKTVHVHPKLPDYDSFAAHFMSLKKDRP